MTSLGFIYCFLSSHITTLLTPTSFWLTFGLVHGPLDFIYNLRKQFFWSSMQRILILTLHLLDFLLCYNDILALYDILSPLNLVALNYIFVLYLLQHPGLSTTPTISSWLYTYPYLLQFIFNLLWFIISALLTIPNSFVKIICYCKLINISFLFFVIL